MVKSTITIPMGAISLEGEIHLPETPLGLVLFAHGSGSSRHSPRNQHVASVLRQAGLGTLLMDLLTAAEEEAEQYTRHLRFNIPLLAERLVAATHWARGSANLKDLKIGYFGSSTGAAAALMAAADPGASVRAVVSRGGRPDLAGDLLERVRAPTLLIVGGDDLPVIPLNEEAFDRLQCEKVLRIVPGASHLFEERGKLEVVSRLAAEWMGDHLQPWPQRG
jgi:putative phosphoribosyl transferase